MQDAHFHAAARPTVIISTPRPLIPGEWIEQVRADFNRRYPTMTVLGPPPTVRKLTRRERAVLAVRGWLLARREALGKRIAPTLLTVEEASDRYGDY